MDGWIEDGDISWMDWVVVTTFILAPVMLVLLSVYALEVLDLSTVEAIDPLRLNTGGRMLQSMVSLLLAAVLLTGGLSAWSAFRDRRERPVRSQRSAL
ncbi:MAG TPA: hypothetical protein VKX16_16695 [Chloroflexota bacterium]|nr:hypothetical protein [Chloroflexota bacterium]